MGLNRAITLTRDFLAGRPGIGKHVFGLPNPYMDSVWHVTALWEALLAGLSGRGALCTSWS